MNFNVITLFPEMIRSSLSCGVVGTALERQLFSLNLVNPRTFVKDVHKTVDDRPFGGGDGMVLKADPLEQAIKSLSGNQGHCVLLSAHGKKWSDAMARQWANPEKGFQQITLVCGRYGGVDQRFINKWVDEEISIGDYILSGGELAALTLIDSTVRLLPQVLGNSQSIDNESFVDGLLEAPLFTRPQDESVPEVFLSGDHEKIKSARRALSLLITKTRRNDLWTEEKELELVKLKSVFKNFTAKQLESCGLSEKVLKDNL